MEYHGLSGLMNFEQLKISKPGIMGVSRWNALVDAVQSSFITAVNGGAFARTKGGTSLWIRPGGGTAEETIRPFQLIVVSDEGDPRIRVVESTLAGGGSEELGFAEGDTPPYLLEPAEGVLVGGITYDVATRYVTSRWLEILPAFPTEIEDGTGYVQLGTITHSGDTWIASNSRYGPITAEIWRNWFAAEAPFFNVIWL